MNIQEKIGFTWGTHIGENILPAREPEKPVFILKKMLPEYVWDLVHIEDNPYSFVDVQTLIEGTTVGGHSLFDQLQVLNQKDALNLLMDKALESPFNLSESLVLQLHDRVANQEALEWGKFRSGEVGIGGTSHRPPESGQLNNIFTEGLAAINTIEQPIERALVYYFWGSRNQFFYDGNKRTSRAVMNYVLLTNGFYYLSVPGRLKDEYNQVMVNFYDNGDATEGMRFLLNCYKDFD